MRLGLMCLLIIVAILCAAAQNRNRGGKGVTQKTDANSREYAKQALEQSKIIEQGN